jgi:hypothetical protein
MHNALVAVLGNTRWTVFAGDGTQQMLMKFNVR